MAAWKRPPEPTPEPEEGSEEGVGNALQALTDGAFVRGLREGDPVTIGATAAVVAAVVLVIFLALRAARDRPRTGRSSGDGPRHMR